MKKAILIDVKKSEVSQIEIKGKLDDFYRYLGCDIIDSVSVPNSEDHDVIVDDEGLLKEICGLFSIDEEKEPQFAGNGIIMAVNEDTGNWLSSRLTVEDVQRRITFWKVITTPLGKILVRVPKKEE